MSIRIRLMTAEDLPEVAELFFKVYALSTDDIMRVLFPKHLQGTPELPSKNSPHEWIIYRKHYKLGTERSVMAVAVDDGCDGQIVGIVSWILPATKNEPECKRAPPRKLSCMDPDADAQFIAAFVEWNNKTFGEEGPGKVLQLDSIAVDPEYRRRGIGKSFLEWGFKLVEGRGVDCYVLALETGLPLYEANGFELLGSHDLFDGKLYSLRKTGLP